MDSRQPSIAQAVPQEERMNIPNNEPADALSPNPLEKQPGHIPIDPSAIDSVSSDENVYGREYTADVSTPCST